MQTNFFWGLKLLDSKADKSYGYGNMMGSKIGRTPTVHKMMFLFYPAFIQLGLTIIMAIPKFYLDHNLYMEESISFESFPR